jgi:tRNA threonylcarbamoyladenosine biosynthesis protein TsaE
VSGARPLQVATVVSRSPAETQAAAAAVAALCRSGDIVLLVGALGSGKTTFAKGAAAALGVAERVTSPTFTLVRPYRTAASDQGLTTLLHADVYRLDHETEMADLGLEQLVEDQAVALVEWGDKAAGVLGHPDERRLTFSTVGAGWGARRPALEEALGTRTTRAG